jgi:hypothetical protein
MYKSEKILTKHSIREFSMLSTGKYITNGSKKGAYTVPVQNYILKNKIRHQFSLQSDEQQSSVLLCLPVSDKRSKKYLKTLKAKI